MIKISQQQAEERFDALPETLKNALISESGADAILEIGQANHLGEERIKKLGSLVGYVILGFLNPRLLVKEIQAELGLNSQAAMSISESLEHDVLTPISGDIYNLYNAPASERPNPTDNLSAGGLLAPAFKGKRYPTVDTPPPIHREPVKETPHKPTDAPKEQELPTPSATSVPKFKRPDTPQLKSTYKPKPPAQPQPKHENEAGDDNQPPSFMLHEEKDIDPLASGDMAPLTRPHFFKSTAEKSQQEKPVAARLEIGQEKEVQQKPKIGRTKKENVRVVNYTGPFVESDPFGKMPKASAQNSEREESEEKSQPKADEPQAQKKEVAEEVSPDNIVNLKDLPK